MASGFSKPFFAILPIVKNVIAILVVTGIYLYLNNAGLFPNYLTYIYWAVNVIISYNILVSSTRSIILPLLSLLAGGAGVYSYTYGSTIPYINLLTFPQCWQLAVLGVIGLLICFAIRLQ